MRIVFQAASTDSVLTTLQHVDNHRHSNAKYAKMFSNVVIITF